MAYGDTFRPAGADRETKVRGPVWAGIFSLVTLGIYALYWIYVTAKDLSEYGKAKGYDLGQNPTMTLLAITIGWIIIVPPLVALWRLTKRVQHAQRLAGVSDRLNGWIALVTYLLISPVYFAYTQSELNKAWAGEGGPVPVGPDDMPPELQRSPEPVSTTPTTSTAGADPTTQQSPVAPSPPPPSSLPPSAPEAPITPPPSGEPPPERPPGA
jgi:hypothetical protein